MSAFDGKVVAITGASEGIGAELARQLAAPGVRLALCARNAERLEAVAAECRTLGAEPLALRADVGVETDCRAFVEGAAGKFGALDVLVNNAGMSGHATFEEVKDFGWYEALMRVNYFGSLWCTRYALPHLRARRGLVVGISSLAARTGVPGRTAYGPSKAAQALFFEALRVELRGSGVDVTIVYPGVVATDIRRRGYGPDGRPAGASGLDERGAMPVEECARQIAAAMASRRRELVMTAQGRIGLWVKMVAPGLVDRMAAAALRKTGSE